MSRRLVGGAAVVTAGATALLISRRIRVTESGADPADAPRSRWRSVTIDRAPDDVLTGDRLPQPLADLGNGIEVEVRAAPGDKGSELRARPRSRRTDSPGGPAGSASTAASASEADWVRDIRAALRRSKQLIEVGEVLRVDPAPHGRRSPSPLGAIVEGATRRADREGLL
jgi:hypothetical protein